MTRIVFIDNPLLPHGLYPFTLTRRVQDIRMGILTIRQKWERHLGLPSADWPGQGIVPTQLPYTSNLLKEDEAIYLIHNNVLPSAAISKAVKSLAPGESLSAPGLPYFVQCITASGIEKTSQLREAKPFATEVKRLSAPWDIFKQNAWAIAEDYALLTAGRTSQKIPVSNQTLHPENIFIEEGAVVEMAFLNGSEGPVYIGRNAVVMEGSLLRGPLAICENAVVKMGAKIYGGTTIGPKCTAGGEIKNAVLFGFSNKAHDGYMGDAVVGEWCNWGAGTSNSNLKNTAADVLAYSPQGPVNVGTKCGVLMGDYSRTAINTSINTGTVIGVCANVFGAGLSPKHIASFAWGMEGAQRYQLEKAFTDINNWKQMKGSAISPSEKQVLKHIFEARQE